MLSTQLQNDYRELSVEARKKHNDIKEAAEKAILTLRSINDTCKDNATQLEELRKSKRELLAPISMSFDSRVSKLMQQALVLSHKLLSHQALNEQGCESVLTALLTSFAAHTAHYLTDEALTVKLLQTLLVLSSVTQFTLSGDYLAQSLNLAFRLLMHSKAPAVQPLAHAAVRQIVSATFDRTWTRLNDAQDQSADSLVQDAARLYKELCHMVNGEKTEWLMNPDLSTRLLGLELIDELLAKHVTLLRTSETLLALTRDTLTKLLVKLFRVTDDYACLLRVLRIVLLFIVNFHGVLMSQVETLITRMISLISDASPSTESSASTSVPASECPLWVQSLVLEVLFQLTQRVQVIAELFRASESASSGHVYERMVVVIGRVVQLMYDWSDEDFTARHVITTSAGTAKLKTYLLDRTALSESINSPVVSSPGGPVTAFEVLDSREYVAMLSCCLIQQLVEDIQGLSQSVSESRDEARDDLGVSDWSIDLSCNLATRSWMTILASLSLMLSRSRDELMLQQILRAYQNFTVTCGVLRLSTPRDAFINSLCSQALPLPRKKNVTGANNSTLTKKNLQVMKTVLNIAHRMGGHLDEAWLTVLQTLERFEQGTRRLPGLEGESDWSASDASLQEEISIAISALSSLFTTSHYLSDDALITLLQQLTLLSNKHFHEIGEDASEGVVLSTTLFGLHKMREVLLANTDRAVLLWPIVECHVLDLAMHLNKHVRFQAVKMLNGTVQAMMQEAINSNKTRTHAITYKMIRSLYELSVNDHVEVRQRVAESVLSIIQSSGQLLHYDSSHVPLDALTSSLDEEDHVIAAWKLVLKFLDQTVLHLDLDLVPVTFKTLDIVCADFLAQFPAKLLPELIRTIGRYADGSRDDPRGHVDVNTSITAVGLLWKVADFTAKDLPLLSALVDDLVLATWRELLIELTRHCVHPLSEVRTASLHTLFGILTTHAGLVHRTLREGPLYAEYLLPLLSHVHETQLKVYRSGTSGGTVPSSAASGLMQHHSRNSELKQWNETLMISIQGVTRVYKTCFDTILAHVPNSPLQLIGYLTYFALSRDQVDVQIAILQAFKELIVTCLNLTDLSASHVIVDSISSLSWRALTWFIVTMPDLGRGHHKLTLALIEALADIQHKCQGRAAVVTRVLSLAEQLVVACVTANVDISTVQRHLLDMVAHVGLNLVLYLDHIEQLVTMVLNIVSLAVGYHHVPKYHVSAENLEHDLTVQQPTWTELHLDLNEDILSRARLTPSRDRWTETTPLTGWQPRDEYLQPKYFSIADKLVKVLSKCWCLLVYCAKNSSEGVMPFIPLAPFTAEDWEHIRQLHLEISPEFPSKIIARLFMDVTAVMGRVAQTRSLPSSGDLWMLAAQFFSHVTLSSMSHVTRHCTQLELTLVVTDLADSIEAYLDNQSSAKNRPVSAEEQERQMQLVAALTEVCVTCLLPCCQLLADDQTMTSRLVTIVLDTAALFTEHEQFACDCYRQLFALLDRRHMTKLEIATSQLILSMVITRCREVCRRFVVDERNSGNLPLPKSRVYELVFVLTQLKQLEVDPSLWSTPTSIDSVNGSPRRHIWELYPELCECIVARETEVKQLLKELLLEAYMTLSLRSDPVQM